ncbi:MAG: PBSX family phage terminase large subunit [Dehalococcoidia bacterium]|jgi:phage terminase large subunit
MPRQRIRYPKIDTGHFSFGGKAQELSTNDTDKINTVYLPYLTNYSRIQIFYGGSSSGKSVFIAQRAVFDVAHSKRNYLVCRQVGRTLRQSAFLEVQNAIDMFGLQDQFRVNKSDMTIFHTSGYQFAFVGLDDVEKLKSIRPAKGAWTDLWIEEATEVERPSVKQLIKRQRGGDAHTPKRLTLSFNPILKSHWIYDEYFSQIGWADDQTEYTSGDLSILKTTYKDNRFLTEDDRKDLENETDKYYYDVYTLGKWGILGNVIFTNWRVEDLSAMRDQFVNRRNGLDFGFSSDPAALSRSHYDRKHKTIYIFDELYERGLTNDMLAVELKRICGADVITADSAEPKSIAELRREGMNVIPAKKGKDSVNFGVQWLQQQIIIVDKKCVNTQNELSQYKWKEDRDGNAIRQPVDKNNHIMDALRYALEDDSLEAYITVVSDPFAGW